MINKKNTKHLTEEDKIIANLKFNDDFHKMQSKLPGGCPGIPKGVYRFKNQQEADDQVNYYTKKNALKRKMIQLNYKNKSQDLLALFK